MPVIFRWVVVLIVEGRVARRPMHHASRLSVHHVAHRPVRTVSTAWTCGQCRKHYTLLRLELCSTFGEAEMVMPVTPLHFFFIFFFLFLRNDGLCISVQCVIKYLILLVGYIYISLYKSFIGL